MTRTPAHRLNEAARFALALHPFIAVCALLLCLAAEKTFIGSLPPLASPLHGLIVASTLVAYNAHALLNANWVANAPVSRFQKRLHIIVMVVAGAAVVGLLPFLSPKLWIGLTVLGIVTALYSTPLLPFRYKQRLKDFGLLKLATLVGTWVLSTTWLPALKWDVPLEILWPEAVIRTLLLLALCVAFDVRDVSNDLRAGIYTLPVRVGVRSAYIIAYLALGACVLFAASMPGLNRASVLAAFVSGAFAAWAIEWSRRHPSEGAYLLLVDGALAVYAITVLLL